MSKMLLGENEGKECEGSSLTLAAQVIYRRGKPQSMIKWLKVHTRVKAMVEDELEVVVSCCGAWCGSTTHKMK